MGQEEKAGGSREFKSSKENGSMAIRVIHTSIDLAGDWIEDCVACAGEYGCM